jgi:micrococcal nuclease
MPRRSRSRHLSKRQTRALVALIAAALALLVYWWDPNAGQPPPLDENASYPVERVVDGDTLLLVNGARIRLIGADTPETVKPDWPVEPWGPEATEFTRRFVEHAPVRLQFDGPRRDKYDRVLAHVWVGDRMLGEELIRAGLARAETSYTYSAAAKARFIAAEAEAKAAGRGIWSRNGTPGFRDAPG